MKQNKWAAVAFWCAGVQIFCIDSMRAEALQSPVDKTVLKGHASSEQPTYYDTLYKAGMKALQEHQYQSAQQKLTTALEELRKHNIVDQRYSQIRAALGWTYVGLDKAHIAQKYFDDAANRSSADEASQGSALAGMAETTALLGSPKKAVIIARRAIEVNEALGGATNQRELGRSYMALGKANGALGLDDEAADAFKKAIAILETTNTRADVDLVDALRLASDEYARQGKTKESKEASARMYDLLDKSVKFDRPSAQAGGINVYWQDGGLRSRQIYDPDYPLKYVWVDGMRVAATLVRSENVIGALISLSNCSRSRREVTLGRVELEELAPLFKHPLELVPPVKLDMALEEQHISALTWRRPWLNHVEKTRRIPGYLHDGILEVDNFFGNNTFGAYGNWGSIAETKTPLVTREQYLYGLSGRKKVGDLASFLSNSQGGQTATYLDPGDSKTGLVFFRYERFDKAKLRIPVGNMTVEMPFASSGPR